MYISPINNNRNINSKAQFSLISEKNLLPRGGAKQLKQKAESIGTNDDLISIAIMSKMILKDKGCSYQIGDKYLGGWSTKICLTHVLKGINSIKDESNIIIEGSFRERKKKTFEYLNGYLDNLKNEYKK
ncbi:hypothetical protein IJO12_08645 [bacterium]|nr:hypothetical protein [bacterium]